MKRFTLGIATAALALGGVAWAAGEAPMAPDKTQTRAEAQAQAICMLTGDFERAYQAFVDKRKPVFEGN